MVNKKRLIALAQKLIRIDSQNPPGDESRIALFVRDYLKQIGVNSRIIEFKKRRSNILATIPGKKKSPVLLITPHLDTVPAGRKWEHDPLSAQIRGKRLYGLGATDCKSNVAAALEAINSLLEDGVKLEYTIAFAATADEESGSGLGLIPLLKKGILKVDQAVVLDADDFDIIVAQKGLIHLKVKLEGKRAHGAYPEAGENAIDKAVAILRQLKTGAHIFGRPQGFLKNKYLRPPTLNVGTIRGGDKVNVVADWCEVGLDLRYLPGMTAENIIKELRQVINKHSPKFTIEIEGVQKPYLIDEAHPLVRSMALAMRTNGIAPRIRGSEGATTITFFQDRHIPAIATGFGCGGCAHTADEYLILNNLYKGTQVLEGFLKIYGF